MLLGAACEARQEGRSKRGAAQTFIGSARHAPCIPNAKRSVGMVVGCVGRMRTEPASGSTTSVNMQPLAYVMHGISRMLVTAHCVSMLGTKETECGCTELAHSRSAVAKRLQPGVICAPYWRTKHLYASMAKPQCVCMWYVLSGGKGGRSPRPVGRLAASPASMIDL